uniref:Uncharacterized protein n=1 Tax=Glossina morsitans morsitans TaxID=37546 RepID=A0A1B0GEE0_GLOMM
MNTYKLESRAYNCVNANPSVNLSAEEIFKCDHAEKSDQLMLTQERSSSSFERVRQRSIKTKINGVEIITLLDTGASTSCCGAGTIFKRLLIQGYQVKAMAADVTTKLMSDLGVDIGYQANTGSAPVNPLKVETEEEK